MFLLAALPGRQDAAHCCDASRGSFLEATPVMGRWSFRAGGCGKQRMDALRRRVSHGWLTEPKSNPRLGTTPRRRPDPVRCNSAELPRMERNPFNPYGAVRMIQIKAQTDTKVDHGGKSKKS